MNVCVSDICDDACVPNRVKGVLNEIATKNIDMKSLTRPSLVAAFLF